MEENNNVNMQENNNNNNVKKGSNIKYILLVIALLIIIGLLSVLVYKVYTDKNNGDDTTSSEVTNAGNDTTSSEVSSEVNKKLTAEEKKSILDLIELTEDGYIKEPIDENHNATDTFGFQSTMRRLNKIGDFTIGDLDNSDIMMITYIYALNNKLLKSISGDEYDYCEAGSGSCSAIKFETYEKIAKLYNIKKDGKLVFDNTYKDYYLYPYGGFVDSELNIADSVEFEEENNYVNVVYKVIATYGCVNGDCNKTASINRTYTYTFKKDTSNNYYLDKINIKNN